MAWLDDRVWCHPKVAGLTDKAFRVHVCAIAYSSGFSTAGVLTEAQQRLVGATTRQRTELIEAGLWDDLNLTPGSVRIHDWDEHNGKRDARRAAERERMRRTRSEQRAHSSAHKPANRRVLTGDGSEGSEGSTSPKAVMHSVAERPPEFTIPELRSVQ